MHNIHHHRPRPDHSKPLAKLLTMVAVLMFVIGGWSSSILSNREQPQPSLVAQLPENFPVGAQRFCSNNCASDTSGGYKFCYNECVAPGKSKSVGCDTNDFIVGPEQSDSECDTYGAPPPPGSDPATREVICNDHCKSNADGSKSPVCYTECHPNKDGYKHDVLCQNDGGGGAQWILENEVFVGTDSCPPLNVSPPPAGQPTATPQPGGGPTATPMPGGANQCTGTGFTCSLNGGDCTKPASQGGMGGTVDNAKTSSCKTGASDPSVCCKLPVGANQCTGAGYTCSFSGGDCTKPASQGGMGGTVDNAKTSSCKTGATDPSVCCTLPAGTPQRQCQQLYGTEGRCILTAECDVGNFPLGAEDKGELGCGTNKTCCRVTVQQQSPGSDQPVPPIKNECEDAGWTCTETFSCMNQGLQPALLTCPTLQKPVCCKIPNKRYIKYGNECEGKSGPYQVGGKCYECFGHLQPLLSETGFGYGKELDSTQPCQRNEVCQEFKQACTLRKGNTCYKCFGYQNGDSFGAKRDCPDTELLPENQCLTKSGISTMIMKACEGLGLSPACKKIFKLFIPALSY